MVRARLFRTPCGAALLNAGFPPCFVVRSARRGTLQILHF